MRNTRRIHLIATLTVRGVPITAIGAEGVAVDRVQAVSPLSVRLQIERITTRLISVERVSPQHIALD